MKKLLHPLLLIVFVSTVIGASTLRSGHEWGDDWAWYVLQAKSIAEGSLDEFIAISDFTNYQSTSHLGPLAYPWGYPLILTPFYILNGISPLTLKIPGLIFYAGFLFTLYFFAKSRFTQTESLLLVSLFAFNPLFLNFLDQILSDIPFLFFSTLTLYLVTREEPRSKWHYAFIGAAIFWTTFLRATGLLLLASFLAVEFFKLLAHRKERDVVKRIILNSFVVCAVFAGLWLANTLIFPGGGESYLTQYENLTVELVRSFIGAYFIVYSWFFGEGTGWQYVYYFILIFAVLGAWIRRNHEPFFLWFFTAWMIVHITYPYWQGPRYIFPLLPIFIYFAFQGMKFLIAKLPEENQWMGQRMFHAFWLLMIGYFLVVSGNRAINNLQNGRAINGPFDPFSVEVYDWIERKTPPDSVLIFYKARVMRLMTDHPSIMINECDGMLKGDYLIVSKKVERNNQVPLDEIDSCNLLLDKELENRRFVIYKIVK
jgi:4-amino-4-deoxy-L-arabinose transferase-like glycosyltransferase